MPEKKKPEKHETHPIDLNELNAAHVKVAHPDGTLFYLEQTNKVGVYTLKPVPQEVNA